MRLALVCFYCLCVFCLCSLFYRDDVLCWLLLARPFLYAFHAHLRFPVDLVWFRLSCDHGWIRSGSVNVRKQQQTTTYIYIFWGGERPWVAYYLYAHIYIFLIYSLDQGVHLLSPFVTYYRLLSPIVTY